MSDIWEYVELGDDGEPVYVRMTEGQILAHFWDWWSQRMRRNGLTPINPDRCIEDWAVVHWAQKVGDE